MGNSTAVAEKNSTKTIETVIKGVSAIKGAPGPLRLYMEICAKCGTCASQCPVYYGSPEKRLNPAARSDLIRDLYKRKCTPWGRLLERTGLNERNGIEIEEWINQFYECTGCRRCATFCPMGIDNSVITRKGRAIIDGLGLTPKRLLDVIKQSESLGNTDGCTPDGFVDSVKFLETEMKEDCGIDIPIPIDVIGAEYFFLPPSGDVLVNPEAIMGTAKLFYVLGLNWTMSSRIFDGANYGLFTGNDDSMKRVNLNCVEEAKRLKCKHLVMGECGHAHRIMKFIMEKSNWWQKLPFDITNILQFTANVIKEKRIKLDRSRNPDPVTYHDPCNFGRSCGIVEEPRVIMSAASADFREMTPNGGANWCCGGGGGLSAMDTIKEFRMTVAGKKKVEQIRATGATYVAAPCSNCKRQLFQLMEYHKMDVRVGGVHDLVYKALELR
jgi:Fe-S oxidoreductase